MESIRAIKGTVDILPGTSERWQRIEKAVRKWMLLFGFSEIRTPIFEETRLFVRSIGEDSDIVGKEMYTFTDLGNRSVTLRPEGTASVVRAFIEHSLDQRGLPQALWYMGPMFRQERPQKGRQRQFHQFGAELIGARGARADVEAMDLFDRIADDLGIGEREYVVNYLGGADSRERYREKLVGFLEKAETALCDDCRRRMRTNPLRVLDCKVPGCRTAVHGSGGLPAIIDFLSTEDRGIFDSIQNMLSDAGIGFRVDPFLVRGLDYYTGVVFEMNLKGLGAQSAVMGGGRYDTLVHDLGGPDIPAVGWACGMERLLLAMESLENAVVGNTGEVYVVSPPGDEGCGIRAHAFVREIRMSGFAAVIDFQGRSVKSQMKVAAKLGAKYVLFVSPGEDAVEVRDMEKSEQERMTFEAFLDILKTKGSPPDSPKGGSRAEKTGI